MRVCGFESNARLMFGTKTNFSTFESVLVCDTMGQIVVAEQQTDNRMEKEIKRCTKYKAGNALML